MSKFGISEMQKKAHESFPRWLQGPASIAAEKFFSNGLPDRTSEEWKYTDLGFLSKYQGKLAVDVNALNGFVGFDKLETQQIAEWSQLRSEINQWLGEPALENLNLAVNTGGSFLQVKKGEAEGVAFSLTSPSLKGFHSPRAVILMGENSELNVFEHSEMGEGELLNAVVDVRLAAGAKLNYVRFQNNQRNSNHISSLRVVQGRDSQFNYFNFSFGADISRDNVFALLNEEGATCNLAGLSVARSGQHHDQFVYIDHKSPGASSHQTFKNIISNRARAVFNGKVRVREGSSGTDARQLNKNLLLGKTAEANTRPQLEIFNDDVKCSHGATIGRLNMEELFYLESRAIPRKTAISILCRAFVDELVLQVPFEAAKTKIMAALDKYFLELETDYGN